MKKSVTAMIAVGALVFGLALGSVGIVQAQSEDTAPDGRFGLVGTVADLLGLTADEFVEQKRAGESLPRIAEDAGVSTDELVDGLYQERLAQVEDLFEDGLITEAQLDWARDNLRDSIEERVMSDGTMGRGFGPGGPHMGRGGGPGQGPGGGACGQGERWNEAPVDGQES